MLLDIVDTPISPELLPADEKGEIVQKTEDLVGPYELHDFFLYHFVRFGCRPAKLHFMACRAFAGKYDAKTVKKWLTVFLRRFFSQQFKRSALPDGPESGIGQSVAPRGLAYAERRFARHVDPRSGKPVNNGPKNSEKSFFLFSFVTNGAYKASYKT